MVRGMHLGEGVQAEAADHCRVMQRLLALAGAVAPDLGDDPAGGCGPT